MDMSTALHPSCSLGVICLCLCVSVIPFITEAFLETVFILTRCDVIGKDVASAAVEYLYFEFVKSFGC